MTSPSESSALRPSTTSVELGSPAATFTEGFPLGNGWLGAMDYGSVGTAELDLNVDTLWSGGPGAAAARHDVAPHALTDLRTAIAAGDFVAADRQARGLQYPGWTEAYQPLGRLRWDYAPGAGAPVPGYRRGLDLAGAVAWVEWETGDGPVRVETFVSAPAGVLVVQVQAPEELLGLAPPQFVAAPQFVVPHPTSESSWSGQDARWAQIAGRAPDVCLPQYLGDVPAAVVHGRQSPDARGLVDTGMGFAAVAAAQRTDTGVRLVVSAHTGFRGHRERPSADVDEIAGVAAARVASALSRSTEDVRAEHVADHRRYFDRVTVRLGTHAVGEKAERYFNVGRYLLISCSRPGSQAANLQGIWNADLRPGWSSNYTTNINLQMNYWGAEVSGLGDLHEPMIDLVTQCVETGRHVAGSVYGAPGSCTHHNTDLWRFGWPVLGEPDWANWQSGLLWMAAHVWEHYVVGSDETFGADVALPVHRAQAAFVLSQLVPDADGGLVVSPSTSPEHRFRTADGQSAAACAGSAMDQELAREVLTRFVTLAERFPGADPLDAQLAADAREALASWRAPVVGTDGCLQEWSTQRDGVEPGHRHLSMLYGLFPGSRITQAGTPELFDAARAALRRRLDHGSGHTSWSQAWLLCLAARLRDGGLVRDSILGLYDRLSSRSLLSLHPLDDWPGGAIFQIDGNLGAVRGIAEMLLQFRDDETIVLLPAVPAEIPDGLARGLRGPGARTVDLEWSHGRPTLARVRGAVAGRVHVEFPGDRFAQVEGRTADGTRVELTTSSGPLPGTATVSWTAQTDTAVTLTFGWSG